jgi:cytochrome c biogenesis protein CcmG, thiol:disulfide interchange protein DsbE
MKKTMVVVLFALAGTWLFAASSTDDASVPPKQIYAKSFLGKKAPDFFVEKWLSATPKLQGKFVLIDFWATWCPPCRESIPELNAFSKKFADKLVVIGISSESAQTVRNFRDVKIEYFSAIDTQSRMSNALAITGIPHVIIMDPDGIVRWEGFPLLEHYELTEKVIADIIANYKAPPLTNPPFPAFPENTP